VSEPLIAGHYGRAAFDAVGPTLLIVWSDVGPQMLQAMNEAGGTAPTPAAAPGATPAGGGAVPAAPCAAPRRQREGGRSAQGGRGRDGDLLELAMAEDARHWELHRRPISAETLRKRLHVGAATSRTLVTRVRAGEPRLPRRHPPSRPPAEVSPASPE
jgi:hypothetical protein